MRISKPIPIAYEWEKKEPAPVYARGSHGTFRLQELLNGTSLFKVVAQKKKAKQGGHTYRWNPTASGGTDPLPTPPGTNSYRRPGSSPSSDGDKLGALAA